MGRLSQAIRKSFLSLFTRKALNTYIQCQDGVIRRHISEWLAQHSDQELDVKRIVRSVPGICWQPLPLPRVSSLELVRKSSQWRKQALEVPYAAAAQGLFPCPQGHERGHVSGGLCWTLPDSSRTRGAPAKSHPSLPSAACSMCSGT